MSKAIIQIRSGALIDLADPDLSLLTIEDVAWSLAQINRFTGHTSRPISVAEHSVNVSLLVPAEFAREGLMHDAHECLINDVAAPLKSLLPDYQRLEERMVKLFARRFELDEPKARLWVREADLVALAMEAWDLMPVDHSPATLARWRECFGERGGYAEPMADPREGFLARAAELGVR